jgi:hypothetical protein
MKETWDVASTESGVPLTFRSKLPLAMMAFLLARQNIATGRCLSRSRRGFKFLRSSLKIGLNCNKVGSRGGVSFQRTAPNFVHLSNHAPRPLRSCLRKATRANVPGTGPLWGCPGKDAGLQYRWGCVRIVRLPEKRPPTTPVHSRRAKATLHLKV